jgi:hypothetical protein
MVDMDLNDGDVQLRNVDQATADSVRAAIARGQSSDVVQPLPVPERTAELPVPLPIPVWVQYGWWPIVKWYRRYRAAMNSLDVMWKMAVLRYFGITGIIQHEAQICDGLRRDLDKTAGSLGQLIPEYNKAAALLKKLRLINHQALHRLEMAEKRQEEKKS